MFVTADMASLAALKVLPIFCARSCKKEMQATPTEQNNLDGTKWRKTMKNHEICFTKIRCFWQLLFASEARRISVDLLLSSITSSQLLMERLFSNPELVSWTQKLLSTNTLTMFSTLIHHDHSHVLVHESIYPFHFNPCCSTRGTFYFWLRRKNWVSQKPVESKVPFGWELGDLRSCGEALSFCEDILVMTLHATVDFWVQNGKTQGFGNITRPEITI